MFPEQVLASPYRYVVLTGSSSVPELIRSGALNAGVEVWSLWSGYLAEPSGIRLRGRQGDLLALEMLAIGHDRNCRGSMGGGVAAQLRHRYAELYSAYRTKCRDGSFRLGSLFAWETEDTVIYNLATQQEPGPDARLGAIETSVRAALADAQARGITTSGLPRLGSGIGGLAWTDVADTLARNRVTGASDRRPAAQSVIRSAFAEGADHPHLNNRRARRVKGRDQVLQQLLAGLPPEFRQAAPPPEK